MTAEINEYPWDEGRHYYKLRQKRSYIELEPSVAYEEGGFALFIELSDADGGSAFIYLDPEETELLTLTIFKMKKEWEEKYGKDS